MNIIRNFNFHYHPDFLKKLKDGVLGYTIDDTINRVLNNQNIDLNDKRKGNRIWNESVTIDQRKQTLSLIQNALGLDLLNYGLDEMSNFRVDILNIYDFTLDKSFLIQLESLFLYSYFRDNHAIDLAKSIPINTCYYCNSTHTAISISKRKKYYDFDHFLPKSIYPFFSVNYKNLIPACANCNRAKSAIDTFVNDYIYYPYDNTIFQNKSFNNDIKFRFSCPKALVNRITSKSTTNILFKYDCSDKTKKYTKKFSIAELYNFHGYLINDLVDKTVRYSVILQPYGEKQKTERIYKELFEKDDEFFRFVTGIHMNPLLMNERPFGKLIYDLAMELKLYWNDIYK